MRSYLEQAVPDVDLWPGIQRKLRRRRLMGLWTRLAPVAALATLVVGVGMVWSQGPRTANLQVILERAKAPSELSTLFIRSQVEIIGKNSPSHYQLDSWYDSAGRYRSEDIKDGQPEFTKVYDGKALWEYFPPQNSLLIYDDPAHGEYPGAVLKSYSAGLAGVEAALRQALKCSEPRVAGKESVDGRSTYLIELGESQCSLDAAATGLQRVWVDRTTYQIVKYVKDDREVTLNVPIPAERFKLVTPAGTKVTDARPEKDLNMAVFLGTMRVAAESVSFPLWFSQDVPTGLSPLAPLSSPFGFEVIYSGRGRRVSITQQAAVSSDVARAYPEAESVVEGNMAGWYTPGKQVTGGARPSTLVTVHGGTFLSFTSYDLTRSELIRMAASLRWVPVGKPMSHENPTPLTLAELRQKVGYPVFALGKLPPGWKRGQPYGGDRLDLAVHVPYTDGKEEQLLVTTAAKGTGLDADPSKTGELVVVIRGFQSITAHFLDNQSEFGGPILWWHEDGAYVVLSGRNQTKESLIGIAPTVTPWSQ